MEIYLIRHTETILSSGYCFGQADIALQEPFSERFLKIEKAIPFHKETALYSSPLKRCALLSEFITERNQNIPQATYEDRLKEINFGEWEAKEWNALDQKILGDWMADFVNYKIPGGESFRELNNRTENFIQECLLPAKQKQTVLITHAGVIRCFLCKVLGMPLQNAFRLPVDHGSLTKIHLGKNNCESRVEFINFLPASPPAPLQKRGE